MKLKIQIIGLADYTEPNIYSEYRMSEIVEDTGRSPQL